MTIYKSFFVDDKKDEARLFSALISELESDGDKIDVTAIELKEVTEMSSEIWKAQLDLLLLDFRLDDDLNGLTINQAYQGGTLAQHLREKVISTPGSKDFPIVLISSENYISKLYSPDRTTSTDLFDCCYPKEKLSNMGASNQEKDKIFKQLVSLIEGYKLLNNNAGKNILSIFSQDSDIQEIMSQQEIVLPLKSSAASHISAQFILKNIIRREGILYSKQEVAAKIGVEENSLTDAVLNLLISKNCKYKDIFSYGWERWWAHRLEKIIEEIVGIRAFNMTAKERVERINDFLPNAKLVPARSQWTNDINQKILFSCCSCNQPTEMKHSLSVFDPLIPRFVQKKRICWACVRDDLYQSKFIEIEESDKRLIKMISNET